MQFLPKLLFIVISLAVFPFGRVCASHLPIVDTVDTHIFNLAVKPSKETIHRRFAFDDLDVEEWAAITTDDLLTYADQIEQQTQQLSQLISAREKVQEAIEVGRFIQRLDSLAWIEFPVVLADTISNVPITIAFDELRLYSDYAQLEVTVKIEIPQQTIASASGNTQDTEYTALYFGTPNLKFSHDGGIIGDALIGLYGDFPIATGNPSKFGFILKGRPYQAGNLANATGTYVKIDCDGFVEMGIDAELLFSRDWVVPLNANGVPESGRVSAHVQTIINDWQNMLFEIDMPDFAPADHTEIGFNLSTAVFDFSDYRNSPNMAFPDNYQQQGWLMPSNVNLWRGVYIKNLDVSLPKQFKEVNCAAAGGSQQQQGGSNSGGGVGVIMMDSQDMYAYEEGPSSFGPSPSAFIPPKPVRETIATNQCRMQVGVEDLLIDGHGVSGQFYADNVLHIDNGKMDKWRYSIDSLSLELLASNITSFGVGGEIGIPISKETQAFKYAALYNIPNKEFNFNLKNTSDLTFPIFKMASVNIAQGSYLDITATPTQFVPVAVLYGHAAVKAKQNSSSPDGDDSQEPVNELAFSAAKLKFEGLRLATQGQKIGLITGGSLGFEGDVKIGPYSLPIGNPTLTVLPNDKVKLGIDFDVNLMAQQDNGFAADGGVAVVGALTNVNGIDKWEIESFEIEDLSVEINLPALEVKGFATFFSDDPTYGRGFQGGLTVKVGPYIPPADPLIAIELNAIFGKTTYKYWYVDGFLELDAMGIPLPPSGFEINGFGGGAYYHMRMAGVNLNGGGSNNSLGTTSSGVTYVPDENITLGLKASVALRTQGTDIVDGVATLELAFAGTALQDIMLYGKAEIAPPNGFAAINKFSDQLQDRVSSLDLPQQQVRNQDDGATGNTYDRILASMFIRMNFTQGFELQGTFRVNINAAQGTVVGQGGVDLLISSPQNRWHLYVGGYNDNSIIANDGQVLPPVSLSLNLAQNFSTTATAYFLAGNDLPGPPPLHPMASAYFGSAANAASNRNTLGGHAANGTGFAFGATIVRQFELRTREQGDYSKNRIAATLAAGFDLALLRYASNTRCSVSGDSPHGHKGWRATGQIWAYVTGNVKYRGVGGNVSLGALVQADLPNPSYLDIYLEVNFIIEVNLNLELGEECGAPIF